MNERRKHHRKDLAFFTRLFDRDTGQLLGHLANLTTEGAMIISNEPIETGKVYRLHMDLSDQGFGKAHLNFEARSIYCQLDITPHSYNVGFQFTNILPRDIGIIEGIVKEYRIRD
jgi:hypothetical protein